MPHDTSFKKKPITHRGTWVMSTRTCTRRGRYPDRTTRAPRDDAPPRAKSPSPSSDYILRIKQPIGNTPQWFSIIAYPPRYPSFRHVARRGLGDGGGGRVGEKAVKYNYRRWYEIGTCSLKRRREETKNPLIYQTKLAVPHTRRGWRTPPLPPTRLQSETPRGSCTG